MRDNVLSYLAGKVCNFCAVRAGLNNQRGGLTAHSGRPMQTAGFSPTGLTQLTAYMQHYVDRGEVSEIVIIHERMLSGTFSI
jgi:hypothetical protein